RVAEFVERQRLHVELEVGALASGVRAREQPELRGRHGERPAAKERVVEPHARAADERAIGLVEGLGAYDLIDEPKLEVILRVVADAGFVGYDGNAGGFGLVGAAAAGGLENRDRADRAGREDPLAAGARQSSHAVLPPAHARRARALERDLFHQAMG